MFSFSVSSCKNLYLFIFSYFYTVSSSSVLYNLVSRFFLSFSSALKFIYEKFSSFVISSIFQFALVSCIQLSSIIKSNFLFKDSIQYLREPIVDLCIFMSFSFLFRSVSSFAILSSYSLELFKSFQCIASTSSESWSTVSCIFSYIDFEENDKVANSFYNLSTVSLQ